MRVLQYIFKRLVFLIPILLGLTTMTFAISRLVPADPARDIAGVHASADAVERVRQKWGFDKPIYEQYVIYMKGLLQGDLGRSSHSRHEVTEDLKLFIPATAELALAALFIMIVAGIPLGVIAAVFKDRALDHISRLTALAGVSFPSFWLALVFQLVFFRKLNWLPAGGRISSTVAPPDTITGLYLVDSVLTGNFEAFSSSLTHLIMPAVVLSLAGLAAIMRMTRTSMLEVMNKDYIKAARAKGVPEWKVIFKHALRNALIPVTTIIGMWTGTLLGGAFIIEYIFSWPGIGFYGASAILSADFAATMGVALFVAIVYIVANLIVDILYMYIDPRLSRG